MSGSGSLFWSLCQMVRKWLLSYIFYRTETHVTVSMVDAIFGESVLIVASFSIPLLFFFLAFPNNETL